MSEFVGRELWVESQFLMKQNNGFQIKEEEVYFGQTHFPGERSRSSGLSFASDIQRITQTKTPMLRLESMRTTQRVLGGCSANSRDEHQQCRAFQENGNGQATRLTSYEVQPQRRANQTND